MPVTKDLQSTKERVLSAALDEFAEHGLAGARVDRIAAGAGVNKAMIYYHFDSKEALYDHILRARLEAGVSGLSHVITDRLTLEEMLRTIAEYHARGFRSDHRLSRLMLRELAAGGETIQRILASLAGKEELRSMIVRLIENGKQSGKYRNADTRHAIISFVGMSMVYHIMAPVINQVWGIENDTEFTKQRPSAIVDLFLHGLEAR
jgi:AcrR family transcriptional regulator